ncbi:hypothetical protein BH09MYX1_BH09MYX1_31260 [soil metagenome]
MHPPMSTPRDAAKDPRPAPGPAGVVVRTGNTNPGLGSHGSDTNPDGAPPDAANDLLSRLDGPLPGYKANASESDGLDSAAFHAPARAPGRSPRDTFDDTRTEEPSQSGIDTSPPARRDEVTKDSARKASSRRIVYAALALFLLLGVVAFAVKLASTGETSTPSQTGAPSASELPSATVTAGAIPTLLATAPASTTATTTASSTASSTATTMKSNATVSPAASARASATSATSATSAVSAPTPTTSGSIDPLTHILGGP